MPGTSHYYEKSNLSNLKPYEKDAAMYLIHNYELADLCAAIKSGADRYLIQKFSSLSDSQWQTVLKKALFSRITSVEINHLFSPEDIEYLLARLSWCVGEKKPFTPKTIYQDYETTRQWLVTAYAILNKNKRLSA